MRSVLKATVAADCAVESLSFFREPPDRPKSDHMGTAAFNRPPTAALITVLGIAVAAPLWAANGRDTAVSAAPSLTASSDPAPYAGPTPHYAVTVQDLAWYDAARGRPVPAKVYCPSSGRGPFPVVIFSPGLGHSRDDCAYLGNYWASCGYVSVHVQHKGSDDEVAQRTLRVRNKLREAFDNPDNIRDRPRDLIFAIDQLERMRRDAAPLAEQLDLERIGVSGHDFGAQTALALAGQVLPGEIAFVEPRVKAVVAMSAPVPVGQVPLSLAYGNIGIPCLHITGTADNSIVATTQASQRRLPFDYAVGTDQYLVTFRGADHMTYSGHVFPLLNGRADGMFQRLIARSSTAFWDAYLRDDVNAKRWLANDGLRAMLGSTAVVEKKLSR